ncbi:MAG: hypothetical protein IPN30_06575 [Flavobacteriales bacterium]|nr:hypothetical protein [Flavobacteriales bacterium]
MEVAGDRTVQLEVNGTATAHIPLARRSTIRLSAQDGTFMVNDDLYVNELYPHRWPQDLARRGRGLHPASST